jgi:hypothetical protein
MTDKALLGMAGVYFVAAELSRLGYVALVTSRNTKAYDILVHNPKSKANLPLQIKTIRQRQKNPLYDNYMVVKVSQRTIQKELRKIDTTYVFVYFPNQGTQRYFIVPPADLRKTIRECWEDYVGPGTRHIKPLREIKKSLHPIGPWIELLISYENRWDLLERVVGEP